METREELKQAIEKRSGALSKQTAKDSKVTLEHVRQTRKLLKRACRRLAKLERNAKARAPKTPEGEKKSDAAPAKA